MRELTDIGEQNHAVFEHMMTIGPITSNEALDLYGIARLASRICDLEKEYGVDVSRKFVPVMKRNGKWTKVKQYWIENKEDYDGEFSAS